MLSISLLFKRESLSLPGITFNIFPRFLVVLRSGLVIMLKSRLYGAPHSEQQPLAELPAKIQGVIKVSGNTAKCAPLYPFNGTVQTSRLFFIPS